MIWCMLAAISFITLAVILLTAPKPKDHISTEENICGTQILRHTRDDPK